METVLIDGVAMLPCAADCVAETNIDVQRDVRALREGVHTRESLTVLCLEHADRDRVPGWRAYVFAVCAEAGVL